MMFQIVIRPSKPTGNASIFVDQSLKCCYFNDLDDLDVIYGLRQFKTIFKIFKFRKCMSRQHRAMGMALRFKFKRGMSYFSISVG